MDDLGGQTLRNVYKICKKYLTHIQNSVFEGDLSPSQLASLKIELKNYLRKNKDSCILFSSKNKKWLKKDFLVEETVDRTSRFL